MLLGKKGWLPLRTSLSKAPSFSQGELGEVEKKSERGPRSMAGKKRRLLTEKGVCFMANRRKDAALLREKEGF